MRPATLPSGNTGTLAAIALAFLLISAAPADKPKETKAEGDYFPLRVGDSWTYRNTEEGGYTIKVLSEEPREGSPPRYLVELLSGVKILKMYSKTPGWVLYHGENYP